MRVFDHPGRCSHENVFEILPESEMSLYTFEIDSSALILETNFGSDLNTVEANLYFIFSVQVKP